MASDLRKKKLLILDLDETLVHATKTPNYEHWDFEVFGYKVFIRPGLDCFLSMLPEHFRIAVWSSASDDYVEQIVKHIFPPDYPLEFVWGRSRCTLRIRPLDIDEDYYINYFERQQYVKVLKKVKRRGLAKLEEILIVDDTPFKAQSNYGNVIYPSEFTGDPKDDELEHLLTYLLRLKDIENVRKIEKRNWRKEIH